jgi:hypothetical protein
MRHCHLIVRYLEPGTSSLLAGLARHANAGRLRLTQEVLALPPPTDDGPWHLRQKADAGLDLVLDGRTTAYVDVHDSWEIDADAYASHDVYFKRSYHPGRLPPAEYPKLRPLGLVNDVRLDGVDLWEARRILAQKIPLAQRATMLLRFLLHSAATFANLGPRPNLSLLHAPPDPAEPPRVLFMAGLWDPSMVPPDVPEKAAEFAAINETRAACIRALRREFGARFFGGVQHTEFARRNFADVLLPDARSASKRAYIRRVRDYPICIATMGLHGSNGWKLAEYVGLSRSIVSEPLEYDVPGRFSAPDNYLGFRSPDSCVEQVSRLMDDAALRGAQMHANHQYYRRWMWPEAMADHVLTTMAGSTP